MSAVRDQARVLVVEDDQWIRFMVADLLKEHGYEALEASNGQTGLRLAEDKRPDVVILDLALPETSGVEVLRELRRLEPFCSPKIVITSAFPELLSPDDRQCVDAVFTKPFNLERLLAVVADLSRTAATHKSLGVDPQVPAS
jgi:DNA-binding response OmpR family regulator